MLPTNAFPFSILFCHGINRPEKFLRRRHRRRRNAIANLIFRNSAYTPRPRVADARFILSATNGELYHVEKGDCASFGERCSTFLFLPVRTSTVRLTRFRFSSAYARVNARSSKGKRTSGISESYSIRPGKSSPQFLSLSLFLSVILFHHPSARPLDC